jgi:hypothetical protein
MVEVVVLVVLGKDMVIVMLLVILVLLVVEVRLVMVVKEELVVLGENLVIVEHQEGPLMVLVVDLVGMTM